MTILLAFLGLAAVATFLVSLIGGLLFRKNRGRRLKIYVPAALVVFFLASGLLGYFANLEAQNEGFISAADKNAANAAGFSDPAAWAPKRAEAEAAAAEAAKVDAEARARGQAEKKAAQAAAAELEAKTKAEKEAADTAAKNAECRASLECWGERATTAAILLGCDDVVERMAKYEVEWKAGFLGVKFSHYRWADIERGIVTVIGDKVTFQNGFGAKVPMIYECDIDVEKDRLVDVRVTEGRL